MWLEGVRIWEVGNFICFFRSYWKNGEWVVEEESEIIVWDKIGKYEEIVCCLFSLLLLLL